MSIRRPKKIVAYNMSCIHSSGSIMERNMASLLWIAGLRGYRRNFKKVFGKPDFCWTRHKMVVFCDSSFWHGYNWGEERKEEFKVRKKFWIKKIERNIERDKEVNKILKKEGWKVLRFWDFQIKKDVDLCVEKIKKVLEK